MPVGANEQEVMHNKVTASVISQEYGLVVK